MSPQVQPSIEERQRTLRSVASALNIVISEGDLRSMVSTSSRRQGRYHRYFPQRRILIAVESSSQGGDYLVVAREVIESALADISGPAQRDCRAALVSWIGPDGSTRAAAFDLAGPEGPVIVGASWQPRHLWHRPMPDPDNSPQEAVYKAIRLVSSEVNRVLSAGQTHDRTGIRGALSLCEQCFLLARGIAPATASSLPPDSGQWPTWLQDFMRAAEAEYVRLFPNERSSTCALLDGRSSSGLLTGVQVFLSYAMPTNVEFARPVMRALELEGAKVWFDQSVRPDEADLDQGLRAVIAAQDIFLFCSSCELFENAGYALQELAWVLDLQEKHGWAGRICVALLDDVLLPRVLNSASTIDLSRTEPKHWPTEIVGLLTREQASPPRALLATSSLPPPRSVAYDKMSVQSLRLRFRHAITWWNLNENAIMRSLAANPGRGSRLPEFGNLNGLIRDLGWDGFLITYDSWPVDPAVRDVRVRLGCLRHLFLVTTIDLAPDDVQKISTDMEFLATRRFPLFEETAVSGWDDEERRLGIRHHLGILTLLARLLQRGLASGLTVNYSEEQRSQWEESIAARRRDCADCLLELRREERLRWGRDRAIGWDRACHELHQFLYEGTEQWIGPVPSWVQVALGGARTDVSAIFADLVWRASRSGACEGRALLVPCGDGDVRMEIIAALGGSTPLPRSVGPARSFALKIRVSPNGTAELELSWSGNKQGPDSASGHALAAKPLQLVR